MDDRAGIGTPGGRPDPVQPRHAARDVPTPGMYPVFPTTDSDEICELLTDLNAEVIRLRQKIAPTFTQVIIIAAGVLLAIVAVLIVLLIGLAVVAQFEDDAAQHAPDTSEFGMDYGVAT